MLISSAILFSIKIRREDQFYIFFRLTGNFRIFFAKQNGQQRRSEATFNAIDIYLNIYIYADFSKFFSSKSKNDVTIAIWWLLITLNCIHSYRKTSLFGWNSKWRLMKTRHSHSFLVFFFYNKQHKTKRFNVVELFRIVTVVVVVIVDLLNSVLL